MIIFEQSGLCSVRDRGCCGKAPEAGLRILSRRRPVPPCSFGGRIFSEVLARQSTGGNSYRCWLEVAVDERMDTAPSAEGASLEPLLAAAAPAGRPAGGAGADEGAAGDSLAAARGSWPPRKCACLIPSKLMLRESAIRYARLRSGTAACSSQASHSA